MKRFFPLALALMMVLSLTACGGGGGKSHELTAQHGAKVRVDIGYTTPGYNGSGAATAVGLSLLQYQLQTEDEALISPLSVLYALGMTMNGASGETLEQMETALRGNVADWNTFFHYLMQASEEHQGDLHLANAIWLRDEEDRLTVNEAFLQNITDFYHAPAYAAPFDQSTVRDINNFVNKHTDGMIEDILDEISPLAAIYLVNALGFEAEWQEKYQPTQVRQGVFTEADGEFETVDFLHSAEHTYITCNDAGGFLKYYRGGDYAFAALLPPPGQSVQEYVASLSADALRDALENHSYRDVIAAIPQFEDDCSMELSDGLKALGMTDLFHEDNADLTAMGSSTMGNLYVSRVLHETAISVTPQGTRAGAATAVEVNDAAAAPSEEPPVEIILDRPFVYLIVETNSMTPLFMGVLSDMD
ncbi:MAG: serpin family protein [Oscillospiraceae bacterium]|nr:serpin family protein [Oscillospiraceae bacterium]